MVHKDSVDDLPAWLAHSDHFYVSQSGSSPYVQSLAQLDDVDVDDIKLCLSCHDKHLDDLTCHQNLLWSHERLQGMELFAGSYLSWLRFPKASLT